MRRIGLALAAVLFAVTANAQTTQTLAWDYPDTLANVQGYTQTVKLDGVAITAAPSCVAVNANLTTCSVPIPTLTAGSHVADITATKSGISQELITNGINPTSGPKAPGNVRVTVIVNVTVP